MIFFSLHDDESIKVHACVSDSYLDTLMVEIIKKLPNEIRKDLLGADSIYSGGIPIEFPMASTQKELYIKHINFELFEANDPNLFFDRDESPNFIGGQKALEEYINNKISYPEPARKNNIRGRVTLTFIVEKDGTIDEVKVLRGIGYGCDDIALSIIRTMPKWKPGTLCCHPRKVHYSLRISFPPNN